METNQEIHDNKYHTNLGGKLMKTKILLTIPILIFLLFVGFALYKDIKIPVYIDFALFVYFMIAMYIVGIKKSKKAR